jgi:hypothetical protein
VENDSAQNEFSFVSGGVNTVETQTATPHGKSSPEASDSLPGKDPRESQGNGTRKICCVILTSASPGPRHG